MIDINLVRDRAQAAPSLTERLVPLLIVVLLIVYAGTVWMASHLHGLASDSVQTLQNDIARAKAVREDVALQPTHYSEQTLRLIEFVGQVATLAEQKQYWAAKLARLKPTLPERLVVQLVTGESGRELEILGHSVGRDQQDLEQMRDFVHNLAQSRQFRRGLSNIQLRQVFSRETQRSQPQRYEFSLRCDFEMRSEEMNMIF